MKSNLKKKRVNYAPKCNQLFLGDYKRMCSGTLNSLLCGWNYLTWQCSVESHNYFTEKNLTGESPGPRIVWWCRQHAETPPPSPLYLSTWGSRCRVDRVRISMGILFQKKEEQFFFSNLNGFYDYLVQKVCWHKHYDFLSWLYIIRFEKWV